VHRFLFLTFALSCLVGCRERPNVDYGGTPIDAPGTFNCFENTLIIKVVQAQGDRFNVSGISI